LAQAVSIDQQKLDPCFFMKPPYIQGIALYALVSCAIRHDITGDVDKTHQLVNSSQQLDIVNQEVVDEISEQQLEVQTEQFFSAHEHQEESDEDVQTPTSVHATGKTVSFKALLVAFSYSKFRGKGLPFTCQDLELVSQWLKGQTNLDATIGYVTDECSAPEGMTNVLPRKSTAVSKASMHKAFKWLLQDAQPGDTLFFYFSGHGFRVGEVAGSGGYSTANQCKGSTKMHDKPLGEALWLPLLDSNDEQRMGPSRYTDTDFYEDVAKKVPQGVHLFAVVDACHSGTFMNLPWNWISQEYYGTCPGHGNENKRVFNKNQFAWEWRSVTSVDDMPQIQGTVSLIAASQSYQRSTESNVKTDGYGAMTSSLFLDNAERSAPAIMNLALQGGWSWAFTISSLIHRMAPSEEANLAKTARLQIPNFCTSHQFDMSEALTLDGAAIKTGKAVEEEFIGKLRLLQSSRKKRKDFEKRLTCIKSDSSAKVNWILEKNCGGTGNGKSS